MSSIIIGDSNANDGGVVGSVGPESSLVTTGDESIGSARGARFVSGTVAAPYRSTTLMSLESVGGSHSNGDKFGEADCDERDMEISDAGVNRSLSVGLYGSERDGVEDGQVVSSPPKLQREFERSPSLGFLRPRRRCLLRTPPQANALDGLSPCSADSSRKRRACEINGLPSSSLNSADAKPQTNSLPNDDAPQTQPPAPATAEERRSLASMSPVMCLSPTTRIGTLQHLSLRSPVAPASPPLIGLHTPGSNGLSSFTVYSRAKNGGGDTSGVSYRTPCSSARSSPRQVPLTILSNVGTPPAEPRSSANCTLLRSPFVLSLDAPGREANGSPVEAQEERMGRTSRPTPETEGPKPPLFPKSPRDGSQLRSNAVSKLSPAQANHMSFHQNATCHLSQKSDQKRRNSSSETCPRSPNDRRNYLPFVHGSVPPLAALLERRESRASTHESPRGEPAWNVPVVEVSSFKASSVLTPSQTGNAGVRSILQMEIGGGHGTDGTLSDSGDDDDDDDDDDDTFFLTPPSVVAAAKQQDAETANPSLETWKSAKQARRGRPAILVDDGTNANEDSSTSSPFEQLKSRPSHPKESPCFDESTHTAATSELTSSLSTTAQSSTVSTCTSVGRGTPARTLDRKLSEHSLASLGLNLDCTSCSSEDEVGRSVPLRDLTTPPGQMFPIRESGVSSLNPPPLRQSEVYLRHNQEPEDGSKICEEAFCGVRNVGARSHQFGSTVVTCVVSADRTSVLNAIKQMDDAANMSSQGRGVLSDASTKHLPGVVVETMPRR